VAPPQYNLYFPTGLALSPDEKYLFVVNANSDLRFSAGSLQVFDLDAIDAVADKWTASCATKCVAPKDCTALGARPLVLACPLTLENNMPADSFVSSVEIGNFGVSAAVQPLNLESGDPSQVLRLFTTVRGDPSVTWVDFDAHARTLACGGSGSFPRCDEGHRMVRLRGDPALPILPPEPFGVAVDAPAGRGFVTHLTTGQVTLVTAPNTVGSTPVLEDVLSGLWAPSQVDGTVGAVGIAPRLPGDPSGLVYVTSRSEARVSMIHAIPGPPSPTGQPTFALARTGSFYFSGLESGGLPADSRNILFTADGNTMYLLGRTPSSLQAFDTSIDATGVPKNDFLGSVEVCNSPANLALADFGNGPRIAVPCFTTGQVWIIDAGQLALEATEDAGRGPSGVAASGLHKKIYVGNYAEDTLMVIDADPAARTQNRVVLRLGVPRPEGQ
jgi:DNA-binding beta-propeller fold protein YncE